MKARRVLAIATGMVTASTLGLAAPSFAATCSTCQANSTTTVAVAGGGYSVTVAAPSTINGTLGGTVAGTLPTGVWADNTGSGAGWNGTVAVSSLNYTGTWTWAGTGTAPTGVLGTATGQYTGTADGVQYTVTISSVSGSTVNFSYTSTDSTDQSGTGTATASATPTPATVGLNGLQISFLTAPAAGNAWTINVGTENASAFSLTGATISNGVTSPSPTFTATKSTVLTAGGVGTYGSAVPFLSAAVNQGMGSYTVTPNVSLSLDSTSWAGTYSANVQYTIAAGP